MGKCVPDRSCAAIEASAEGAEENLPRGGLLPAAASGNRQLVLQLLEEAHDPNAAERHSLWTPLLFAAYRGHGGVADKEKARNDRKTPLHLAAMRGHEAVPQCLLAAGADKQKAAKDGFAPLHLAAMLGHEAVAQCLLEAGADK